MLKIFKKDRRPSEESGQSSGGDKDAVTLDEAEKYCVDIEENCESRSKLSKQLCDILKDRNCLCYLIQYLETRDALSLIKFYIDVESFQKAAELCGDNGGVVPRNAEKGQMPRSVSADGFEGISMRSQSMESVSSFSTETNVPDLSDVDEEDESRPEMSKEEKTKANLQSTVIADAIRIYRKYLVRTSVFYVDIPATISSTISLALCDKDEISASLFSAAQDFVYQQLETDFLEQFLASVFYCKYTVDVLTSDNLTLHDILSNESILFYFMEFLEQEEARNFLEFWISAVGYKRNMSEHYDKQQAQSDALVLYEKYFSLQATTPLNISCNVRFMIENRICSVNEPVSGSFDLPLRIVEFYLDRNHLRPFLKSNLFYKYLSELFTKINESKMPASNKKKCHKRNHSEPISNGNTLLAMESRTKSKTANMQIESQQMYDPDLLWRRRDPKALSFGRVDAFGRYQREFDLDPSMKMNEWTSGTNKLKNAVRRLVKLPEDKVQEEIAWQVAEMIVKDVTSITLNQEQLPSSTMSSDGTQTL